MIILFFIIVALPFVFIGYFAYSKSVETVEAVNSTVSLDMIGRTGKNVDAFLREINDVQNDIMKSPDVQAVLSREPVNRLDEINLSSELVRLMNAKNNAQNSLTTVRIFPWEPSRYPAFLNAAYPGVDIETQAWFTWSKERGKPYWHLFMPEDNPNVFNEPTIARIKRLYSLERTQSRGVVAMEIKEGVFRDYLSPLMLVDEQRIMLVHDGIVFYDSAAVATGGQVPHEELASLMMRARSDSKTVDLDGRKFMVTYTSLDYTAWKLVSLIPLEQLTRPVEGIMRMTLLFLCFYFALSLFTIIYITVRFSNPIQRLVLHMKHIERGDFSVRWPLIRRNDEVGLLYHGLSHMTRRLSELVSNLSKAAQEKKELEFQVLTHQINPHFLYNTLDAIRWKAEKRNAKDISDMVQSLAELLRLSLNDGKEMTTVARELDHVRAFVRIQQARQDVSIRLVVLVDDELLELPILRLLLQPLVENSIKHGGRARRGEEIKIVVLGTREGDVMRFEISDNGPGIPPDVRNHLLRPEKAGENEERKGVGLRNVHERLHIYFGESFGLHIRDDTSGGTVVEIVHPVIRSH